MQRKTICDREWMETFHADWLAEQEQALGGRITEITFYGVDDSRRMPRGDKPVNVHLEIKYGA